MLKKSMLKISFVSAGNVFNALLGFLFLSAVAKSLTVEEFGKYALLTTVLVSLSKIMDFGTNSIFVAQNFIETLRHKRDFISSKYLLFLIAIVVSMAILGILGLLSSYLVVIFIAGLVGYGVNITLFALFQKEEQYKKIILLNTIPAVIKTVFAVLVFLNVFSLTTEIAFTIFSLSIFGSLFLLRHVKREEKLPDITFESVRMIKKSTPAGISQLIREGWPALSSTIAKMTGAFTGVGIFSIADKISNIFTLISLSIFTVLLPQNSERKKQKLKIDFTETFVLSIAIILMAVGAIFASKLFVSEAFDGKFNNAAQILGILISSSAITAIYTFMENYFFVEDRPGDILIINTGRLGTFLVLCFHLVPIAGLNGLAWSHLVSSMVALAVTIYFTRLYKK
ncbi:MAG: oligosaccharide flippase family protein [Patescibacteria group bacterium]